MSVGVPLSLVVSPVPVVAAPRLHRPWQPVAHGFILVPPPRESASLRRNFVFRGARVFHPLQFQLLLCFPFLLIIRVLQEVWWWFLVVGPGGIADLHLHELLQEHVGSVWSLGRVEHGHAGGHRLLLDMLGRVEADAVDRLHHGTDHVEDVSESSLAEVQEQDSVQVQSRVARHTFYNHEFLDAAGNGADLDALFFGDGDLEIFDWW